MSAEKSFVEKNNSELTSYGELEKKNNSNAKTEEDCGWSTPGCVSNVQGKKLEVK